MLQEELYLYVCVRVWCVCVNLLYIYIALKPDSVFGLATWYGLDARGVRRPAGTIHFSVLPYHPDLL